MFEKFFSQFLYPQAIVLGANIDTRTPEQIAKDYHINEIVAQATPVVWVETPKDMIRTFPVQNQGQKVDCVAESRRKLSRIIFKVNRGLDLDFSSVEFYRRRSNYPEGGMVADDALRIHREEGMTLNALVPSDEVVNEADANAIKIKEENVNIAKVFTITNEVVFNIGDTETPAGTIQKTRKGVMAWYFFTQEEWSREVPIVINTSLRCTDNRALRHSIVLIEPALYRGIKGFWIEDSAHFGGLNRRFITEEFHKIRNFWLSYPINFKFDQLTPIKPQYVGTVVSLQDCLKAEGLFPTNVQSTGLFGNITTQAVKDFQKKYGIQQTGSVGTITTARLKEIYP